MVEHLSPMEGTAATNAEQTAGIHRTSEATSESGTTPVAGGVATAEPAPATESPPRRPSQRRRDDETVPHSQEPAPPQQQSRR